MISPLLMLALDSDVCPTSVPSPVAPLNTYTFLNDRHNLRNVLGQHGLKRSTVSFISYEGGHSRVTDIQPLHERMFEPKPYFLSTFRDRQVFI